MRRFAFEEASLNPIEEIDIDLILEHLVNINDATQIIKNANEVVHSDF